MSSEERLRFAQAIIDGLVFIKDSIAKPPSGGEGFYAALKARTTWALVTPAIVIAYIVVFGMMLVGTGSLSDPQTLVVLNVEDFAAVAGDLTRHGRSADSAVVATRAGTTTQQM